MIYLYSFSETEAINQIISLIKEEKSRLDNGITIGTRVIIRLSSLLTDIAFNTKRFEATQSFLYLSFVITLLDMYFEKALRKSVLERLNMSNKYDIPIFIKNMFKREIDFLSRKYFDEVYIPKLERIKEVFTTFKEYGEIEGITIKLIALIGECTEDIIKEINIKVGMFCEEVIRALKETHSLNTLKEKIEEFTVNLHSKVYGWP
jgi:hypothetical protein